MTKIDLGRKILVGIVSFLYINAKNLVPNTRLKLIIALAFYNRIWIFSRLAGSRFLRQLEKYVASPQSLFERLIAKIIMISIPEFSDMAFSRPIALQSAI